MSALMNEILRRLERHPGDAPWSCVECYHGRPCIDSQILRAALSRVEIFDVLRKARHFVEREADMRATGSSDSYEREPVKLLADIDAALAKAAAP